MKKIVLILIIVISVVIAQDRIIAKIGNEVITAKDFEFMYETSYKLQPVYFLPDTSRANFLYSLIAYKLWYLDAKEKGFKLSEINQLQLDYIKKNLLKDAVYKKEILDKIQITKQDKDKAYTRISQDLECYSIASPDSILIFEFYKSLKNGFPFLAIYENDEFKNQNQPIKITYGTLTDEKLEDILYSLKPGQYSEPYKINNLWAIYYLNLVYKSPFVIDIHTKEKADKILKQRKADELVEKYLNQILQNNKYSINNKLLLKFVDDIFPYLFEKSDKQVTYYTLHSKVMLDLIKNTSQDSLNMPFMKSKIVNLTYKDFLIFMFNNNFKVYNKTKKNLYANIKSLIPEMFKNEVLYTQANKLGVQNDPYFIKEYRKWEEYYYGRFATNAALDTIGISQKEIERYKEVLSNITFIAKIISNDSLEVFEKIINEYNTKNFDDLAQKYSNNKSYIIKINNNENSQYLNFVKDSKEKDLVGPINVNNTYHLLYIVNKKEAAKDSVEIDTFSKIASKRMGSLATYTAKLAIKYGLKVDENVLNSLQLTNTNMMTYKLLGFGGRMLANPFIEQYVDWVKYWKELQLNP